MRILPSLQRAASLSWPRIRLLAGKSLALVATTAADRLFSLRRVVALACRPVADQAGHDRMDIDEFSWSVQTATWLVLVRAVCFRGSLALHRMFRWRRIVARLYYSIGNAVAANAWMTAGARIATGECAEECIAWVAV